MVTWEELDTRNMVSHVGDYENGIAHMNITERAGRQSVNWKDEIQAVR